ncbi:CheR family methyltransferase [Hahella sp. NBU794]|uniref:CheR family methyltransferase n=1 Tax=Hahella sp. NBU794 TaxID=3422590 RepID=UPI003D6E2B88
MVKIVASEGAAPKSGLYRIGDREFAIVKRFVHDAAGIFLTDAKKNLVTGRLAKRLQAHNLQSYGDYLKLIDADAEERQIALNLLTTNETYFFREPQHFDFMQRHILPQRARGRPFRVWSAACSTGEEPYSIAMLLDDSLGQSNWEILATDISTDVLTHARRGCYSMQRAQHMPPNYLRRYCLKGVGPEDGNLLVDKKLRGVVQFKNLNLNATLPNVGLFDVIFLRNVMIYFQADTKRQLIAKLIQHLHKGGHLFIGRSESLNGVTEQLEQICPAVYRKP